MKFNKRGDIGFFEAMMATMVVIIVLMAYMGIIAFDSTRTETDEPDFDETILENISIKNSKIVGDIEKNLISLMERNGYQGITILCSVPGNFKYPDTKYVVGEMNVSIFSEKILKSIDTDNGQNIPTIFEVAICE